MRSGLLAVLCVASGVLHAQTTLPTAAQTAVSAWLAHNPLSLLGTSATIVLEIPGANPSAPVGRAQAAELLRRYLSPATERAVSIRSATEVAPGNGFVELDRSYSVTGTEDVRHETIYLRYRRLGAGWQLTEVRAAP